MTAAADFPPESGMRPDVWAEVNDEEHGPISNPLPVLQFTTVAIERLERGYC